MIFTELEGDDLGVYQDDFHQVVQCFGGHIVFSYSQKGESMTIHVASDKIGLRHIKRAINDFCEWLFKNYGCKMIFGYIRTPSFERLANKCGFKYLGNFHDFGIYVRQP